MKKIIVIIMIFFTHFSYSQTEMVDDPKNHYNVVDTKFEKKYNKIDTLYFYFKSKKKEKRIINKLFAPPNIMINSYYFLFKKSSHYYRFKYLTHDYHNGKPKIKTNPYIIKNKKSFFKKNKKEVLTFKTFKKLSFKDIESFYWKNKDKIVYLIDKKENTKDNVFLREVNFYSSYRPRQ